MTLLKLVNALLGSIVKLPLHGGWVPLFPAPTAAGLWRLSDIGGALARVAWAAMLKVAV